MTPFHACRRAALSRACAWALLAWGLGGTRATAAEEVHVAVAANFTAAAQVLATAFERASGHRVTLSPGPTGRLAAQIRRGAPFQVFLSADESHPRQLVQDGWAVAGTQRTYAIGRLVLWSPKVHFVDGNGAVLRGNAWRHLAVAQPELAPYGAAAMATLRALGLEERLKPRIVWATSVAQAHQFAASGNAELAFVAWAQIAGDGQRAPAGSYWTVPSTLHPPIRQDAVRLRPGENSSAAAAFLDFVFSPQAQRIIERHGYESP